VTVLVVPDRGWDRGQLRTLRGLQMAGYRLAGHGWRHEVDGLRGWRQGLHGALFSRRVAEHLGLDAEGIAALIGRCFRWFGDQDLDPPELYVPPAWVMGAVPRQRLAMLPFRLFETFGGVYDARATRFMGLPLLGYEADTRLRAPALRLWNGINRLAARRVGPVRIAIHPFDLGHRLASSLRAHLAYYRRCVAYTELAGAGEGGSCLRPSPRSTGHGAAPDRASPPA
jgi:predicted deacetylase